MSNKKILIFAPHPDDEILGVGGTIKKLVNKGYESTVCIVTKGCSPLFSDISVKQTRAEQIQAHKILGITKRIFLDYPAARLESIPRYQLNESICKVIQEEKPEIVFMPHAYDMQKDHQMVSDAVMVAVRPKYAHKVSTVLAYETLSETEWNIPNQNNCFVPNLFVDTDYDEIKKKRNENFQEACLLFNSLNSMKPEMYYDGSCVPMVYPLVVEDDSLLPRLQKAKHFQGHWWNYLLKEVSASSFEYWLARFIMPITIDQRYTKEQLVTIRNTIKG